MGSPEENPTVTLLYFAWVREGMGRTREIVVLPETVTSVGDLVTHLRTQGPAQARTLEDPARLRFAVNETHASLSEAVSPGDEIAIFPPVTGG